jgi:crotonobetainyl-CoA:carnitine CoA-transferase CaiB-like acyl-CoA transferase
MTMAGPMEGINVVELGVWVAAPAAGGILADWGADIIKIEPPTGDPARMFGRMLGIEDGVSPPFEMDNRGKRSIVLDLTTDDGRSTALELLSEADVFLTNVRPAALRRVGLDFETVADRSPPGVRLDHRLRRERARRRSRGVRRRRVLGPVRPRVLTHAPR